MRVRVDTGEGVSREQAQAAGERITALAGYTDPEPTDGRLLAAQATGDIVLDAAATVADRLGRKLRRVAREARVAVPGEWLSWARAARRGWDWRGTLVRADVSRLR
jgi:hypothetical protein